MSRRRKKKTPKPRKKKPQAFNIGNASGNNFMEYIDDIWAQHGVVRIRTKDGNMHTLTTAMAAARCKAINDMPLPAWHAKKRDMFLTKAIEVIREARSQQENKSLGSAKTQAVQNVLAGLTAEGKEAPKVTDEDTAIYMLKLEFPMLEEDDIRAIYREESLDLPRKKMLMGEINRVRFAESGIMPPGV